MRLRRRRILITVIAAGLFQLGVALQPVEDRPAHADPGSISVDEKANGSTLEAAPGQVIEVRLHSTYWRIDGSSADSVVSQTGESWVKAAPREECLPGMGCGTIGASFTARQRGTARITASRVSCGEAMACPPEQRLFVVTVVVR